MAVFGSVFDARFGGISVYDFKINRDGEKNGI